MWLGQALRGSSAAAAIILLLGCTAARADSDADRLRDALRTSTQQLRTLEDQRAAVQAKLADAERDKAAMKAQLDQARADLKQAEKQRRDLVQEFNQRLAERDDTLSKWKSAYEEAATVARAKDAERAKFESEATSYKATTKSCLAKNAQLMKVGRELLLRYEALTIGDIAVAREPLLQARRVEIQNLLQDYQDKLLDQKATQ
jgi:chromosome segregation ATPase